MKKRSLFAELKEGFDELAAERQGKTTLRSTVVEVADPVEVSPAEKHPKTLEHLAAL